jgi:ATP-dependent metalloprotease
MGIIFILMFRFSFSDGVIVIGATNTPEILDKALIRPGRFDRMVPVQLPDLRGRTNILKVHLKDVKIDSSVQAEILARGTPGFSGADLKNLINNAAIKASKDNCDFVTMKHLEWSKDRILMGAERKSALISPKNKLITAYHEVI